MNQQHDIYDYDRLELVATLHASLLTFMRFFFKIMNNRDFSMPNPPGRESHIITLCKAFTEIFRNPGGYHNFHIPVGYAKSTLASYFVAWGMARYPDSHYIYASYSKSLSSTHTEIIRRIIQLPEYKELFGVEIRHDARGKEKFQTNHGGVVAAVGTGGTVTGLSAGQPDLDRWSGCLIIDDPQKPEEVHSDVQRENVNRNYNETLAQRVRGINVPTLLIAQRLHEADLGSYIMNGATGHKWNSIIIPALDVNDNPLWPEKDPKDFLISKRDTDIYTFASQYQQDPQPAGGALFKEDNFVQLDNEPDMIATFITVDGAESIKKYADYTAFSFFGLYEIEMGNQKTGEYGLHWIDCLETKIEPDQIEDEFKLLLSRSNMYPIKPSLIAIEKKSSGTFLYSMIKGLRGVNVRPIDRTIKSGSKTDRFISMQPYISHKLVSLPSRGHHTLQCIKHMSKITANDTHAHDDICDTLADAIQIGLIERSLLNLSNKDNMDAIRKANLETIKRTQARRNLYYGSSGSNVFR